MADSVIEIQGKDSQAPQTWTKGAVPRDWLHQSARSIDYLRACIAPPRRLLPHLKGRASDP